MMTTRRKKRAMVSMATGCGLLIAGSLAAQPSVTSVTRLDPNPTNASTVRFDWQISQLVSGADITDLITADTGTLAGTSVVSVTPHQASTFVFNGTDTAMTIDRLVQDDFSIEFWVSTTQSMGSANNWRSGRGIVDSSQSSSQNDFGVTLGGGQIMFGTGNPDVTLTSGVSVADGVWRHVAATRQRSTGQLLLYINGVQVDSDLGNTNVLDINQIIRVGSIATGQRHFQGVLDELLIWNTVRTPAEVQQDMLQSVVGDEAGLVGYYPFDFLEDLSEGGDGSDDLRDESGSGNHGDTTGSFGAGAFTGLSGKYTVVTNTGTGSGLHTINVVDNNSIVNGNTVALGGPAAGDGNYSAGEQYTIDRSAPVITPVSITSDNADPSFAGAGDTVTVSFTSDENISGLVILIAGQPAVISGGPTNWTATYTLTGSETEGPIAFSIAGYQDTLGNAGTTISSVTDGSSVTADFSSPSLGTVSISSNNANPSQATTGDTITVTFSSSENLTGATVLIAGQAATLSGGPTSWSASYVVAGTETQGPASVSISYTDLAGNAGTPAAGPTDGSAVNLDYTAPVLSPVSWGSNNANPALAKPGDTVTVTFTSSEDLDDATVFIVGQAAILSGGPTAWTATYTLTGSETEGPLSFSITPYDDLAGNVGSPVTGSTDGSAITFDATTPSINSIIRSNDATTDRDAVVFEVTFSEPVGSSFTADDVTATGTVTGGAQIYVPGINADPLFFVVVAMNDTFGNGTAGFDLTGSITDLAGNTLSLAIVGPQNTLMNYSSGDVDRNGVVDLVDVALLSDYNLGLVGSLP